MASQKKNIRIEDLELNEGQLYGLPKNPRWIRDVRFEALKKSIEDAPEMLDLRELLVYPLDDVEEKKGKYIIIGGNMRYRACKEIGYKEIPCKVLDIETPVKKLREYTIKDNEAFGQNDYDLLSGEWDSDELLSFGMEIDGLGEADFDESDVESEKEKKDLSNSIDAEYKIEVTCVNETEQEQLYNKLIGEGYECRILTL